MKKLSLTKINVLNSFEARTDNWSFELFEKELQNAMGDTYGNYQTAKMTILEANKEGRWPNTVKRYILSNYKKNNNSPGELINIFNQIWSSLTEQEKSYWTPTKIKPHISVKQNYL